MDDKFILDWWLKKYSPQIINYITTVIQFEELESLQLEERRKQLLLEFLDRSESGLLLYIMSKNPRFLVALYDAIYNPKNGEGMQYGQEK